MEWKSLAIVACLAVILLFWWATVSGSDTASQQAKDWTAPIGVICITVAFIATLFIHKYT